MGEDGQSRRPPGGRGSRCAGECLSLEAETGRQRRAPTPAVLKQRDRVEPVNRMLRDRLDNLLPVLMRETGIDLWVVINREYAEDPVYLTLVPEPTFAARRTTMLVFFD